ncbi:DoxX family membrane protein [Cellulomonas endophytica]|uniref:DoxX family membrane protein n=1 Tax=Cellulomonas endophytica TaxID=2494735 RepID=UPI001011236F|nr:DoxX family membrane protein [Cellulomonas endophytica]
MLLRRLTRPLFAAWFVAQGVDVARRPTPHADDVRRTIARWEHLVPEGPARQAVHGLTPAQLQTAARVHGAAMAGAGALLALGRAPRLSALTLAALTAPIVVADLPDKGADRAEPTRARARRERLVTALSMTAGAVLVAADRQGRPSLAWRVEHARATKAALAAATARAAAGTKRTRAARRAVEKDLAAARRTAAVVGARASALPARAAAGTAKAAAAGTAKAAAGTATLATVGRIAKAAAVKASKS